MTNSVIAMPGPIEEATLVVERWTKAFTESDLDTIVGLYAPDAVFLGTGTRTLLSGTEDIRKYFRVAFQPTRKFVATVVDRAVTTASDAAVVVTVLDKHVVTEDGKSEERLGRVTFVIAKRESSWKIVSFHRSAMPT